MSPSPLPPSIVGKVRDRHANRRGRVRVELSEVQGRWLLGLVAAAMKGVDIDDPDFRPAYLLFKSLSDQIANLSNKPKE